MFCLLYNIVTDFLPKAFSSKTLIFFLLQVILYSIQSNSFKEVKQL